jgi:hypothetical protein
MLPNENIPPQVVPMILFRLRDYLQQELIHEVPETNPTRAVLVKVGRMQENPVDTNVSIAISGGDFEDPTYGDGRIDGNAMESIIVRYLPVTEIGGGWVWWRRGTINVQVYFVRQRFEEDKATQYAYDFYGRLLRALDHAPLDNINDNYGEMVIPPLYTESATFFESGGSNKFIWRGKVRWQVLTWRPPD